MGAFKVWNGTAWEVVPTQGATGPAGPMGLQGPQGIQGIQGPAGALGRIDYKWITAGQGGFGATAADITGLSITWTATAGRYYKISAQVEVTGSVAGDLPVVTITDGANAIVARSSANLGGAGFPHTYNPEVTQFGLSGSVTRKVRLARGAGSGALAVSADPTFLSFILVEDIGAV